MHLQGENLLFGSQFTCLSGFGPQFPWLLEHDTQQANCSSSDIFDYMLFFSLFICWRFSGQHTGALARVDRNDRHQRTSDGDRSDRPLQPVRPVEGRNTRRPRTSSSGGTPSEFEELGFPWGRHATQDALERRRDEQRTAKGLEKIRVWEIE